MKYIYTTLMLVLSLFANSCQENITEPCGTDAKIKISTKYRECNGDINQCDGIANKSKISIFQNRANTSMFLDSGYTVNGVYNYTPPQSGCGISNLSIFAEFQDGFSPIDLNYICKDTVVEICIPVNCPDTNIVDCQNLNNTDNIKFIDELTGNNCIPVNAPQKGSYYYQSRSLFNNSSSNIRISGLAGLKNWNRNFESGKFRLRLPSLFDNYINGNDVVIPPNNRINLVFEVNSGEIGTYHSELNYNMNCEGGGGSGTGVWNIILDAEVCETPCGCPVDKNSMERKVQAEALTQGQRRSYNDVSIFEITQAQLKEGCYMEINDIVRITDSGVEYSSRGWNNNPYTINAANPEDSWTITSRAPFSNLKAGDMFKLNFEVLANNSGYLRDTFRIKTTIRDASGAVTDADCDYDFYLEGRVCAYACAELIVPNSGGILANQVNTSGLTDIWDMSQWAGTAAPRKLNGNEAIPLEAYKNVKELFYDLTTTFSPDDACKSSNDKPNSLQFRLKLPSNVVYCDAVKNYSFDSKVSPYPNNHFERYNEDLKYFKHTPLLFSNVDVNGVLIDINFQAPTIQEFIAIKASDPGREDFKYRLTIADNENDQNCHIVINLRAKIDSIPKVGPIRQLYAYSQVTPQQEIPDKMAVRIDEWHQGDNLWGVDKNQVGNQAGNLNAPSSDDSFFINVSNPSDTSAKRQAPLLGLVPNGNTFNAIEKVNIQYNSNNAFMNGYPNLINNTIFNNGRFALSSPRYSSSFNGTNGITVQAGEVYAVWSDSDRYGINNNPCKLALIYIYEVNDGASAPNQSGVSNIRYRIVYPINK